MKSSQPTFLHLVSAVCKFYLILPHTCLKIQVLFRLDSIWVRHCENVVLEPHEFHIAMTNLHHRIPNSLGYLYIIAHSFVCVCDTLASCTFTVAYISKFNSLTQDWNISCSYMAYSHIHTNEYKSLPPDTVMLSHGFQSIWYSVWTSLVW